MRAACHRPRTLLAVACDDTTTPQVPQFGGRGGAGEGSCCGGGNYESGACPVALVHTASNGPERTASTYAVPMDVGTPQVYAVPVLGRVAGHAAGNYQYHVPGSDAGGSAEGLHRSVAAGERVRAFDPSPHECTCDM